MVAQDIDLEIFFLIGAKFVFQNQFVREKRVKKTESRGTAPRRQSRVVPLCATFKVAKGVEKVLS